MSTYGPSSFTLRDRLAVADAVLRVDRADLVSTSVDDLAAREQREIGHFEFHVAAVWAGDTGSSIRVVAVRGRDGRWPIPTDTPFVALVQHDKVSGNWTLVHQSAFALERGGFRFSPATGCDGATMRGERVTLGELRRTLADLAKERQARARALTENEPDASKGRWFGEMEIPPASLASLQGRETGGMTGTPSGARNPRDTRKR